MFPVWWHSPGLSTLRHHTAGRSFTCSTGCRLCGSSGRAAPLGSGQLSGELTTHACKALLSHTSILQCPRLTAVSSHPQLAPGSIFAALADGSTPAAKLHAARANAMRTLFVLGQLARNGEHVQAAESCQRTAATACHGRVTQMQWLSVTAGGSIVEAAATEIPASGAHPPTLRELMGILIAFHSLPAGERLH